MIKVELKATGDNASGKTLLLNKIKLFLEDFGLIADISSEDEHKLVISGDVGKMNKMKTKEQLRKEIDEINKEHNRALKNLKEEVLKKSKGTKR